MKSVEYYKREEKLIHGLTEEQLKEAFTLYENKVLNEILLEVKKEYDIDFDQANVKELLKILISKAIYKGMEITENTRLVTDYYKEMKTLNISELTQYEFEVNNGVSGVLTTEGEFIKCAYGEHHLIFRENENINQYSCLYFSSFCDGERTEGNISHSPFYFKGITEKQKNWIKENEIYFDKGQNEIVQTWKNNGKI